MRGCLEVARTGVTAVLLHPLRSLVTVVCLLVVLVPYLVGTGIAAGLAREADASVRFGADLYVSGDQFGRRAPIPLTVLTALRQVPGVTAAVPRIVGAVELGKDRIPAVVVGIPADSLPTGTRCVEGRLYRDGEPNELVVGTGLARRLHLRTGSRIPPFYRNDRGERLSKVVGLFRSDSPLWQSRLILTSLETAAAIFSQEGMANEVLVYCRPGAIAVVRKSIGELFVSGAPGGVKRCRIISRSDLEALLPAGLSHRSGLFQLHFLLALAVTILVLTVTSGIGLPDRRREIGVLKATGWQTDEVLLRGAVESSLIGVGAGALALILSFVWLKVGNGFGIAGLFLSGVAASPSFEVPFQLAPQPALLSFAFAWIVVTAGTLAASWRAAIVSPRAAMG